MFCCCFIFSNCVVSECFFDWDVLLKCVAEWGIFWNFGLTWKYWILEVLRHIKSVISQNKWPFLDWFSPQSIEFYFAMKLIKSLHASLLRFLLSLTQSLNHLFRTSPIYILFISNLLIFLLRQWIGYFLCLYISIQFKLTFLAKDLFFVWGKKRSKK